MLTKEKMLPLGTWFLAFSMFACGTQSSGERGFAFNRALTKLNFEMVGLPINQSTVRLTWVPQEGIDPTAEVIVMKRKKVPSDSFSEVPGSVLYSRKTTEVSGLDADTSYEFFGYLRVDQLFSPKSPVAELKTFAAGQSSWPAPQNFTAVASVTKITLSWAYTLQTNFDQISKLEVFRQEGTSASLVKVLERTGTNVSLLSFEDSTAVYGPTYGYRLKVSYVDSTPARELTLAQQVGLLANSTILPAPSSLVDDTKYVNPNTDGQINDPFFLASVTINWSYTASPGENGHNGFRAVIMFDAASSGVFEEVGGGAETSDVSAITFKDISTMICRGAATSARLKIAIRSISSQGNESPFKETGVHTCWQQ